MILHRHHWRPLQYIAGEVVGLRKLLLSEKSYASLGKVGFQFISIFDFLSAGPTSTHRAEENKDG
jgi:hypothetical protein